MNVSHMTSKVLAILALFLISTSSLRADLIIEVKDAQVLVNSVGYVDVLIYSTDTDNLSIFGYEFQISTNTTNSQLRFQALQGFAGSDIDEYVFPTDAQALGTPDPDGAQSIAGGDSLPLDANDAQTSVDIAGGAANAKTLVRLVVKHEIVGLTEEAAIGDEFDITLVNPVFIGTDALGELVDVPIHASSVTAGKITIVATPEPATWLLLSSAVATFWGSRRLRSKRLSAAA